MRCRRCCISDATAPARRPASVLRCVWPYFNLVPGLARHHSRHQMRCVAKPLEPAAPSTSAQRCGPSPRRSGYCIEVADIAAKLQPCAHSRRCTVSDRSGTFARSRVRAPSQAAALPVSGSFLPRRPGLRRRGAYFPPRPVRLGAVLCALGLGIVRLPLQCSRGDRSGWRRRYSSPPRSRSPRRRFLPCAANFPKAPEAAKVPLVVSRLLVCAFVGETFRRHSLCPLLPSDWDVASDCARRCRLLRY